LIDLKPHYRRRAFLSGYAILLICCHASPAARADAALPHKNNSGSAPASKETTLPAKFVQPAAVSMHVAVAKVAAKPVPYVLPVLPGAPPPPGAVRLRSFKDLTLSLGTNRIQTSTGIRIDYTDPIEKKQMTLTATSAEYDGATGKVTASGGIYLERPEGDYRAIFTGSEIEYNLQDNIGFVTGANVVTSTFRLAGKRIESRADGSILVQDGAYTACLLGKPDYLIRAHSLTVAPGKYVSARKITFYLGKTPVITLPSIRRSLVTSTAAPTPLPGYNKTDGVFVRLRDSPIVETHRALDFDARFNLRTLPAGFISYTTDIARTSPNALPPRGQRLLLTDPLRSFLDQLTPTTYREYSEARFEEEWLPRATLSGTIQNRQFVYNRRNDDLVVSRLPEVSVHFANVLGHTSVPSGAGDLLASDPDLNDPSHSRINSVRRRIPNAPFLLDVIGSVGSYREDPTNRARGRASLQISAASQPILIGRRLSLRFAATDWLNYYTQGTGYNLLAPEAQLDYLPTRESRFGIGYRYLTDTGRTPFIFDRRDVRHELNLLFTVGGPIAFGITTKFDLERSQVYDTQATLLKNFDCMQVGLSYRLRSQSINIIFNLIPPTPSRARPSVPLLENGGKTSR